MTAICATPAPLVDAIKVRIPGLSSDVPFRCDIWGVPIQRGGSLGPDALSPVYEMRRTHDAVGRELLDIDVYPAPLDRKI